MYVGLTWNKETIKVWSGTSNKFLQNSPEKVLRVRKHGNMATSDAGMKQAVEKRSVFKSFSSRTSMTHLQDNLTRESGTTTTTVSNIEHN
jgi:hypothetical protein